MHLDSKTALDLVEGTTAQAERRFWSRHLGSCDECMGELLNWSALKERVARSHLLSAPDDLLVSVTQICRAATKTVEFPTPLRQIVARITFDSFVQPALAGVRHAFAAHHEMVVRHVISQTEAFDIHLRISIIDQSRELLGQILPRDNGSFIKNARLHLRREDKRIGSAKLNDLGEFRFTDVPNGRLSLQIDLPHLTVISAVCDSAESTG